MDKIYRKPSICGECSAYKRRRAFKLLKEKWVRLVFQNEHIGWFKVNSRETKYNVSVEYRLKQHRNVIFRWNCDCRYQSVIGVPNGAICSHILACIYYHRLREDN